MKCLCAVPAVDGQLRKNGDLGNIRLVVMGSPDVENGGHLTELSDHPKLKERNTDFHFLTGK